MSHPAIGDSPACEKIMPECYLGVCDCMSVSVRDLTGVYFAEGAAFNLLVAKGMALLEMQDMADAGKSVHGYDPLAWCAYVDDYARTLVEGAFKETQRLQIALNAVKADRDALRRDLDAALARAERLSLTVYGSDGLGPR